jgi:hypothetical protein
MHLSEHHAGLTIVRCAGDLGLEELARVAATAARARAERRLVVVDLARVTHLHYGGARLLQDVPGLRTAGANRYVRDLLRAGAGTMEIFGSVPEACGAA